MQGPEYGSELPKSKTPSKSPISSRRLLNQGSCITHVGAQGSTAADFCNPEKVILKDLVSNSGMSPLRLEVVPSESPQLRGSKRAVRKIPEGLRLLVRRRRWKSRKKRNDWLSRWRRRGGWVPRKPILLMKEYELFSAESSSKVGLSGWRAYLSTLE